MRKWKRSAFFLCLLAVCTAALSGCGAKTADQEQIRQALESNDEFHFLKAGEQIEEVVIEKRQTDRKQKTDRIWCTVVTKDEEASCSKKAVLTYGLYDKSGWMLDDIEVESKELWDMSPLKGVEKSALPDLLSGQVIMIDGEKWPVTREALENAKIEKQQTNLEQKRDEVTISLVLEEELEKAEGKMDLLFTFEQEWKLDSVMQKDEFAVSMKEEYELNVSEEDLTALILGQELPVGETRQTILVQKENISDFKISEHQSENKGGLQIYRCKYTVTRSQTALEMETTVLYEYQAGEGWSGAVQETVSRVTAADIQGIWRGTYIAGLHEENAELRISEVKEDGTVTAVFKFAEGSYELSGTWDRDSLKLHLEPGNWIEEPAKVRFSNDKGKLSGELKLEKDRLEANTGQGPVYFIYAGN